MLYNQEVKLFFMKKSIYEIILDSLAPDECYFCRKLGDSICRDCLKTRCNFSNFLSRPNAIISKEFYLSKRSGELRKIVDEFKLQSKRQNVRYLSHLFADFLNSNEVFNQNRDRIILVPVPTLSAHIRERGFDHTQILAKQLSRILKIESSEIIAKVSKTTQRGANFQTRQIQAKKSYQFLGEKLSKDKIYVILDDIRTTGATLNSIAEILLKNGVGEIWAFYLLQQ